MDAGIHNYAAVTNELLFRAEADGIIVGWGLQRLLDYVKLNYKNPAAIIHENGLPMTSDDSSNPAAHNDTARIKFLQMYIKNLLPDLDAWNLYLVNWGYNTQKEREEAASIPRIWLLELSDFSTKGCTETFSPISLSCETLGINSLEKYITYKYTNMLCRPLKDIKESEKPTTEKSESVDIGFGLGGNGLGFDIGTGDGSGFGISISLVSVLWMLESLEAWTILKHYPLSSTTLFRSITIWNGSNLKGYFVWSFLDVFKVTGGYTSHFGLYGVDFRDKERRRYPRQGIGKLRFHRSLCNWLSKIGKVVRDVTEAYSRPPYFSQTIPDGAAEACWLGCSMIVAAALITFFVSSTLLL
ncbi:hypothetical protein IFM89_038108 [Coptis chinensis]|uniref:Uncharacterized protein n=1 Tax=Coptis chinensis TaxID=261450 RepID=A0A835H9I7_9MAGN|nr:hypothetical protein IFM89_038108 [Coptis chinensis]